nr:glycosyltransferase family 2 protein [Gemmatimonadaceae bacterium]
MNTLVLMAGPDDAFREAGYQYPKNLTELEGLPLMQHVTDNLAAVRALGGKFICCIRRDENERHHTAAALRLLVPDAIVVEVGATTGGAACTALLAAQWIDNDEPLLITNGDQLINADLVAMTRGFADKGLDGGIVVFQAVHPRWSYARVDETGLVVETAEKRPISKFATAGTYYYSRGADFVRGAMAMIRKDANVN